MSSRDELALAGHVVLRERRPPKDFQGDLLAVGLRQRIERVQYLLARLGHVLEPHRNLEIAPGGPPLPEGGDRTRRRPNQGEKQRESDSARTLPPANRRVKAEVSGWATNGWGGDTPWVPVALALGEHRGERPSASAVIVGESPISNMPRTSPGFHGSS